MEMTTLRTAAQQALEALLTPGGAQACSTCQNGPENEYCCRMEMWSAVAALRAALKQEEEASAWLAERKEHWRKEREKAQQVKTCAWRDNLDAIYETECGNLHIVNDGTLEENGMKYCCYCGKEIKDESST